VITDPLINWSCGNPEVRLRDPVDTGDHAVH